MFIIASLVILIVVIIIIIKFFNIRQTCFPLFKEELHWWIFPYKYDTDAIIEHMSIGFYPSYGCIYHKLT